MALVNISIVQIAKEAGVSPMTVSRVLNGYSPKRTAASARAEVIRAIAERMGYKKNSAPLAMLKGRFDAVALLGSDVRKHNSMPEERMNGIQQVLKENGMKLLVFRENDSLLTDDNYVPSILRELMVDGLLVDYVHDVPKRMVELILKSKIPTIWMNVNRPNDSLYFDDFQASYNLTQEYIRLGYSEIALLYPTNDNNDGELMHYSIVERKRGYVNAMKDSGLNANIIYESTNGYETQPQKIIPLLECMPRPQVIITYMIYQAMNIVSCCSHVGIRVPQELSVTTFSKELSLSRALRIPAVINPEFEMGRAATQMLLNKIKSPKKTLRSKIFLGKIDKMYLV